MDRETGIQGLQAKNSPSERNVDDAQGTLPSRV